MATPLAHRKRKHAEIVDLTSDDDSATPARGATKNDEVAQPAQKQRRKLEDDDFGGDDGSVFEDALDEIELNPYASTDGDDEALSEDLAARLRAQLRDDGPQQFMQKYLTNEDIPHRLLGTAFGINPNLDVPQEMYLRVLGLAIQRSYNKRQKLAQYNTIDDAAKLLRTSHNIMVITGAGISTSLGIPDFRSKGTGFYERIRTLGYEDGEDVFNIDNFDDKPNIFYSLAGDILPDQKRFSPTHAFLRLLQDKDRLQTNYTQNIDNLEGLAGIDKERLIQCHGSFATASCRKCRHKVPGEEIFDDIRAKRVARCRRCTQTIAKQPKKKQKAFKLRKNDWEDSSDDGGEYDVPEAGVMKPDITFFGEQLPDNFFQRFTERDAKNVDLVVVIGTSLKVAPVSEMPNYLPHHVPQIFISREPIQHVNFDIQLIGDCDHVVFELCRRAGWSLKHEMIPPHFRVKVRPVEGSNCMWTVKPRKPKADGSTSDEGSKIESTPRRRDNAVEATPRRQEHTAEALPRRQKFAVEATPRRQVSAVEAVQRRRETTVDATPRQRDINVDSGMRHHEDTVDLTPQHRKGKILAPAARQNEKVDTAPQGKKATIFTALYQPH
ncbi:hypothetical protein LTR85_006172 [Meristemomyces frigidus]|nr:hypothetical protein LTR85_006172 [Meristemomyces frigidus]